MKRQIFNIILIALLTTCFSCNDFLNENPEPRATLDTPKSVSQLLVSAYPNTIYHQFLETMTDNVGDVGAWVYYVKEVDDAFWWRNINSEDQDTPTGYWMSCYEAVAAANLALEFIYKQQDTTLAYSAQMGEAFMCRAYAHFMVVNIFAKPYNPETAETDLGVPYVTESGKRVFKSYKRETVAKVYELIEKDLKRGLELISDDSYQVPDYHFNSLAAHAFASRFYLFKMDWDKVIKAADYVVGYGAKPATKLRDWNGAYDSYDYYELESAYTATTEVSNLLLYNVITSWGRLPYWRFKFTTEINNELYSAAPSGGTLSYAIYGTTQYKHIPKFKEWFKRVSINANYGWPYVMAPLLTSEEALLNRAEAFAMKGMETEAIADLNSFYSKRIDSYNPVSHLITPAKVTTYAKRLPDNLDPFVPIPDEMNDLMKVVIDTKRKEFLEEGLRWFDIRRLRIAVLHETANKKQRDVLQKEDTRKTLEIPEQAISAGLTPNHKPLLIDNPEELTFRIKKKIYQTIKFTDR